MSSSRKEFAGRQPREIAYPDIPRGDDLVGRTVDAANQALIDIFPHFEHPRYESRLITAGRIKFLPEEDMIAIEQQDKPAEAIGLLGALRDCGVNEDMLKGFMYTLPGHLTYCNTSLKNPTFYLQDSMYLQLTSGIPQERAEAAGFLGGQLIQANLNALPEIRELPRNPWASQIRLNMKTVLFRDTMRDIFESEGLDLNDLAKVEAESLAKIDADDTRFFTRGSRIFLVLGGQAPATAEFLVGNTFNRGIALQLSKRVRREFVARMVKAGIPMLVNDHGLLTRNEEREAEASQEVLRAIGLPANDTVLTAYLESDIPDEYHTSVRVYSGKRGDERDNTILTLYPA